jgi:hypothetical protein
VVLLFVFRDWLSTGVATFGGLAALAVAGAIWWGLVREESLRKECYSRLCQLDCPMSCCVPMVKSLAEGDPLDPKDIAEYIKGGVIPRCPCGPEYEVVWVVGGPPPRCPYHGDLLKEEDHSH